MNTAYSESKNYLVSCPFNPNHKVKKCRLITHKKICPDKNNKGFVQCPYNPNHYVTIENLEKHKDKCPNKNVINSDLEKEMEEFIKNQKTEIKAKKIEDKKLIEEKENMLNNQPEIEGIKIKKKKNRTQKIKKKNKPKNEEIKEKYIDLDNIENMTNKELFLIFNENMVIEYHSDTSENNEEDGEDKEGKKLEEKLED